MQDTSEKEFYGLCREKIVLTRKNITLTLNC